MNSLLLVLKFDGKSFAVIPYWGETCNVRRQSLRESNKRITDFLLLVLNDFPAADREFQRLTASLGSVSAGKGIAPSPKPTPEAKPATLMVSSDPQNAQVYVDGQLKGTANHNGLAEALLPGTYQLRVTLPGYKDFTESFTLSSGDDRKVEVHLERVGPPPFTVGNITELLKGGVSPKRVAVLVQQRGVSFALDDDSERRIRDAGGDAELLVVIAKAKK